MELAIVVITGICIGLMIWYVSTRWLGRARVVFICKSCNGETAIYSDSDTHEFIQEHKPCEEKIGRRNLLKVRILCDSIPNGKRLAARYEGMDIAIERFSDQ